MNQNQVKSLVGQEFIKLLRPNQIVGLGSGSTVEATLVELNKNLELRKTLQFVRSSLKIAQFATNLGFKVLEKNVATDLTFDGADWVNPQKQLIKGYGGALLGEKKLTKNTTKYYILVDQTKLVQTFENCFIPVEIKVNSEKKVVDLIQKNSEFATYQTSKLRKNTENQAYVTDSGNWILDVSFSKILDLTKLDLFLHTLENVVETGIFLNPTNAIFVGYLDGKVKRK
jgi:ribose 5-phosphate isomerase A